MDRPAFAKSQRAVESREKNGGNWLRNHLWCANDPCGYGIGEGEGEGTCRGHSENSCRLGVLSEPDPDPRIRIVQSDRLISQVCNVRSAPVYVSNRTFSSNNFALEFSFPSNSSFPILPTGKQTMRGRSGKKVE